MKTLVEDEELRRLRAMAEGTKPFERSGLWDRLSALDWSEIKKTLVRARVDQFAVLTSGFRAS